MRVLTIAFACAAGVALAGISDDPVECLSGCSGKTLADNAHIAGKKCTAATEQDVQLDCICKSDVLITALDACILSICPRLFANIDVVQELRRNCNIGNAAPARGNEAFVPMVTAAGALIAGMLLF